MNPPVNVKIQGLFKAFVCFQVLFKANFIFKDFQDSPVYSSPFQPVQTLHCFYTTRTNPWEG